MDEIPIENESRKKFEKTVKGIKKLLKTGKINPVEQVEAMVAAKAKGKQGSVTTRKERGVVYIGHIPHGFYEDQMKSYFSQFGKVTNVRVARSAKTGRSKGFAFVEFLNKEVAEIVAETMNNYLMDKRLLKAEYIPPERQRPKYFLGKPWVPGKRCPGVFNRKKEVFRKNKEATSEEWLKEARKRIKRLHKLKATLRTMDIDYDFFQPSEVPEELKDYNPAEPNQQPKKNEVKDKKNEIKDKKNEIKDKKNETKDKKNETKDKKNETKDKKVDIKIKRIGVKTVKGEIKSKKVETKDKKSDVKGKRSIGKKDSPSPGKKRKNKI